MTNSGKTVKTKHSPLRAVYLDTNVLMPSWPFDIPAATKQILHLAELLHITVYVPLPVEAELEAHWQREDLKSIVEAAKTLERDVSRLASGWKLEQVPEPSLLLNSYRSLREALKTQHRLSTSPFTQMTLNELFCSAVQRDFPFEQEGKNFQDAVILHSVLEHNVAQGSMPGAFLSRNKRDFVESSFNRLNDRFRAGVRYFSTETALEEHLLIGLTTVVAELWTQNQESAKTAIEQVFADLEKFLIDKYIKTGDVQLRLKGVHDVKTFLLNKSDVGSIPFSFLVDVDFVMDIPHAAPSVIGRTVSVTGEGEFKGGAYEKMLFQSAELT
jgi:PIN domain-containing protein